MMYPEPRIRLARPDIGEEEVEAVGRVLSSSVLTNGPETAAFERAFSAYHQTEYGVAFANGTLALVAIWAALGIGPGDEVIVPSLTFVSSATSVSLVGATPVFAEIRPDTFNLDPRDVAQRLTPATKAILVVHYGGQPADLEALCALADDAAVALVEDAAEAHGARYQGRPVGGWGRAGMFSFTPTKNITTGEGGLVTTDDGSLAERLQLLRNHGQTALYQHEVLGWNMRITEMQAAMGRCQLAKLPFILERKQNNAQMLGRLLGPVDGVKAPYVAPERDHPYMLYTLRVDKGRDHLLHELRTAGIEARVYFPPVHHQPIYRGGGADLPITDDVATQILSVPMHSRMTPAEIEDIASTIIASVQRFRNLE